MGGVHEAAAALTASISLGDVSWDASCMHDPLAGSIQDQDASQHCVYRDDPLKLALLHRCRAAKAKAASKGYNETMLSKQADDEPKVCHS